MPLRIAIAPNAFKGTLTALQAATAISRGILSAIPNARTTLIPVADGGDGTALAIAQATGGRLLVSRVQDPLGRPVSAIWGLTGDKQTAIIEMAAASGLVLLKPKERNPLHTCTFGTGQLIKAALDRGVRWILIGIGGSATNDGGTGMARALGIRFLDKKGRDLPRGGGALTNLAHIDFSRLHPRLHQTHIEVACDVNNPLTGPRGAAHVYAPQKGATPAMVKHLDAGLAQFARVLKNDLGLAVDKVPGAGAAGGMGAGLLAFAQGQLRPGIDIVVDAVELRQRLKGCDLVITGEGRMDPQTAHGKAPAGVARVAQSLHIPAIAICGSMSADAADHLPPGLLACFSALEELMPESDLPTRAPAMLTHCAKQIAILLAQSPTFARLL
jgi:glycerate 2-kinase